MTKEQAMKSGLKPVNGKAGFAKLVAQADGPLVSAIVRYIRKGGDIYLRTTSVWNEHTQAINAAMHKVSLNGGKS